MLVRIQVHNLLFSWASLGRQQTPKLLARHGAYVNAVQFIFHHFQNQETTMPGTSLPSSVPQRVQHIAAVVSAYNMLQQLETTILAENDHATITVVTRGKSKRDVDLMYCRIVGHFFHHVPSDRGLHNLVREVSSTGGDQQKLLDLGKLYYDAIRLCEFILMVFCPFLSVLIKPQSDLQNDGLLCNLITLLTHPSILWLTWPKACLKSQ